MTPPPNQNDLKFFLRFPFLDPSRLAKLATGGLMSLPNLVLPGLGMTFTYGYVWQLLHGMLREQREPFLPEWVDWERIFVEGLKLFTVRLTYVLPSFLVSAVLTILAFIPLYWTDVNGRPLSTETMLLVLGLGLGLALLAGLSLFALLSLFSLPAACHWVAAGSFRQAFQVRAWWPVMRANLGGFLRAFLVGLVLQAAITLVSLLLTLTILLIPFLPFLSGVAQTYAATVTWALAAQAYQEGLSRSSQASR